MKKLKLRKWVKVVLFALLCFDLIIIIHDFGTHKTIVNEVGKHYVCYGKVIQVCKGEDYDSR